MNSDLRRTSRLVAIAGLIAAATWAAFSPALSAGFVYWDDDKNFLENADWRGLSLEHLRWMATTFHGGPYQPLSWLSLAIEQALFGLNPHAFHATNLALHAATAIAFFFLARRILALAAPGVAGEFAAFSAALFFAVHPLRVESVAWITERRDVLSGLFYVLAVLAYLRAAAEDRGRRRTIFLATGLFAFLLGLLAKASGIALPVALVLLDRWPLERTWRESLVEKVPFALLAVPFAVLALLGQASVPHELRALGEHGIAERLAQSAYAAVFYATKTLAPVRLSPIYEFSGSIDPFALRFAGATAVAAAVTGILFALRRSIPAGWTAWAAFLVILAPVSGIVQAGPQLVADRYSYLACMPFALLAAGVLFSRLPKIAPAVALAVVTALGVLTWNQTMLWRDTEVLFTRALEIDPRSRIAHDVVGKMLGMRGRLEEAEGHYRRSIEIAPGFPIPHNNLGLLLLQEGKVDAAIAEFRESVRVQSDYARGRANLGAALIRRGDAVEAESVLREAVRREPRDSGARTNLGQALLAQGRASDSVAELEAALAANPRQAEAHEGLAQAYTKLGRADLAEEHRRAASRLRASR